MSALWMAFVLVALFAALGGLVFGWMLWGRAAREAVRLAALRDETQQDLEAAREAFAELRLRHDTLIGEHGTSHARAVQADTLALSLAQAQAAQSDLRAQFATLEAQSREREAGLAAQIAQLQDMRTSLEKDFAALADKALSSSRDNFLALANETFSKHRETAARDLGENKEQLMQLMAPMGETLAKYQSSLAEAEAARQRDTGGLRELLSHMQVQNAALKSETQKLVHVLKSQSKTRGRWGEQQLRNVLEMAGLSAYSDFRTEVSVAGEDGQLRPDVVVRLPGGRDLIIDAKVSLNAYLEAHDTEDDATRAAALANHAKSIRTHVNQLSGKNYWQQFEAADFVVMFVPGEHFLTAALELDLDLYNDAFEKRVVLAAPTTLIALARTVGMLWRQEKMSQQARVVADLGRELYKRLRKMGEHLEGVSKHLGKTVESYNSFVGSLENQVLPQARRFAELELEGTEKPLEMLQQVDALPRLAAARDFSSDDSSPRKLQ